MRIRIFVVTAMVLSLAAGFLLGQKEKILSIVDLGGIRINGSRVAGTTGKQINLVIVHSGEVSIPCILLDAKKPTGLASEEPLGAAISCAWSDSVIAELTAK